MKLQSDQYTFDLNNPIPIAIPVGRQQNVNAFYLRQPQMQTVEAGGFVGDVNRGGSCNVEDLCFSPHGNGTHTECVGHISKETVFLKDVLQTFFFTSLLISVEAQEKVTRNALEQQLKDKPEATALIIRTLPNSAEKVHKNYSGTNPPFISKEAMELIAEKDFQHLLIDLPSVDKEDDPNLTGHHIFWNYPAEKTSQKTITELVFVPDEIADGLYLLNLMVPAIEMDAAPSWPVLYPLS